MDFTLVVVFILNVLPDPCEICLDAEKGEPYLLNVIFSKFFKFLYYYIP